MNRLTPQFALSGDGLATMPTFGHNRPMSYTAKRLILLLMAWGLIVFAGITVRINLSQRPVVVPPTPPGAAAAAPLATPSTAAGVPADLQATLQGDPNNVPALIALADLSYKAQDWEGAILLYQRIVALQPHEANTLVRLAAAQLYAVHLSEAQQTLEQAVQIAPDRADAHLLLGLTLSRATPPDLPRARQEWQRVISLVPGTDLAQQAQALLSQGAAQP